MSLAWKMWVAEMRARNGITVVWVTHNSMQARRVGERAILVLNGDVVEHSPVGQFFTVATSSQTQDFLGGRLA